MAKGRKNVVICPNGCGLDITDVAEHQCPMLVPTDHQHVFNEAGEACRCGLTVTQAIRMAGQGALERDIPSASTACANCDAPITDDERRASGLCSECLVASMRAQGKPSLVLNADALRVCTECGAMFDTATDLDTHRTAEHPPETRARTLGRKSVQAAEVERTTRLRELEDALAVCTRDIARFRDLAEAELRRLGLAV